ncbi:hypothetical protein UPYG_G00088920 [Umbra pygmaea]|uniref:EGF-like domain-containing protein n=1 Tax=Umbra pygmaea TaxID=75934 RepID=A0ABD0XFC8_UMBPY
MFTDIVGCQADFWGPHCSNRCQCQNEAKCNPITGACVCTDGYQGWRCEEPCEAGFYGKGCQLECQCLNGATCHHKTGECLCAPGYTGATCGEQCPFGSHGALCEQRCPCQNGGTCHHVTGECACPPGWMGSVCAQPCQFGTYGINCSQECPCRNGGLCDHISGQCQCTSGYAGERCQEECPVGSYGPQCAYKCDCQNGARCYHINGACLCDEGFKGPSCQDRFCPSGLYGLICDRYCPCNTSNTLSCHPLSGECVCAAGWSGMFCNETCPSGYHGDGCEFPCACANGADCEGITGACICGPGYIGDDCSLTCPAGMYGTNCSSSCSCHNEIACSHVDGSCICKEGWQGVDCTFPCSSGTWGLSCNQTCLCYNGAACDPINGTCTCSPGWRSDYCDTPCPEGTYGEQCREQCSCVHADGCDHVSGSCRCLAGWTATASSHPLFLWGRRTKLGNIPPSIHPPLHLISAVFTVPVYVWRVNGVLAVPIPATVRTEALAHLRMARVCVPRGTEALPADARVLQGSTASAVASLVLSVSTVMVPVTTSLGTVSVCLDSLVLSATKCVPVAGLVKPARRRVCAVATVPVTPSMDPACAILDGSETTAPKSVLRVRGGLTVSTPVTVTTGLCAMPPTESVAAALAGLDCTVHNVVVLGSLVLIALNCELKCPPGTFGYGCQQLCECQNNATCDYVTGTCYCSIGYKGIRCDQAALMMEELNPYTKISPALASERQSAGAVMGIIFLLVLIVTMLAVAVWWRHRQREKGGHHMPSVSYTPALRITSQDYSLSGETLQPAPISHGLQCTGLLSSSDTCPTNGTANQCFTNPSYHTLGPCSSHYAKRYPTTRGNKVKNKRLNRNSAPEWTAYYNLNELGLYCVDRRFSSYHEQYYRDYMKGSLSSTLSLSSENPYATISDPLALVCKHSESSYVEMKSPARHQVPYCSTAIVTTTAHGANKNVYDVEPTVSVVQACNGVAVPTYPQNPYDLPRNSHIPSHYDLLPLRHSQSYSPTHSQGHGIQGRSPIMPGSPTSSLL